MKPVGRRINMNDMARKVDVDNRISLRNYYRIADNLLKQANIYREEKNLVDLYIILLRYSSLVSDTIPCHGDYLVLLPRERIKHRKEILNVVDELESLKPRVQHKVDELNKAIENQLGSPKRTIHNAPAYALEPSSLKKQGFSTVDIKQLNAVGRSASQSSWKRNNETNQTFASNSTQIVKRFDKLSMSLPLPKEETLSRHSIFGRNGLQGQLPGPSTAVKVYYPKNVDLIPQDSGLNKAGQYGGVTQIKSQSEGERQIMDSVLSLDDGRWQNRAELSSGKDAGEDFQINIIRQPSPPPVLAQVQQVAIPPSKVADPRPGPAYSPDGPSHANSYQELHIPVKMMDDFLRLAQTNTKKNLETCGVLAGSLRNRVFCITTLIIPKQESTSDSCQTMNEEEIFEYQDRLSLFPLGWIHTHPSQTCFMSSVDLHTHYSYQIMLPEAIAIVMAPTDTSSPCGIFHLCDPGGVSVIRSCDQRGFHTHEEPDDGGAIYEHCSHVYMDPSGGFEVADLRWA